MRVRDALLTAAQSYSLSGFVLFDESCCCI